MAVEGISGAGMTYQGSTSTAEVRRETQVKLDAAEAQVTSEQLSADTRAIDTKKASADGGAEGGSRNMEDPLAKKRNKQIKKAVDGINMRANNAEAIFGIHEETNRVTIKLVDKETKKVIKELPPEKTLDMIARVWELAGLLVDEKR